MSSERFDQAVGKLHAIDPLSLTPDQLIEYVKAYSAANISTYLNRLVKVEADRLDLTVSTMGRLSAAVEDQTTALSVALNKALAEQTSALIVAMHATKPQ